MNAVSSSPPRFLLATSEHYSNYLQPGNERSGIMQPLSTVLMLSLTASLATATSHLAHHSTASSAFAHNGSGSSEGSSRDGKVTSSLEKMQSDEGTIFAFTESAVSNSTEVTMLTDHLLFPTASTECQESSFESMINFTQYNFPGKCVVNSSIGLSSLLGLD